MGELLRIDLPGDELHNKLGGGVPKNSIVLLEGKDGVGKSVLSQRLVYGALENDHTVSYVTSEMTMTEFLDQMDSFSYDIKQDLIKKRLKFVTLFTTLQNIDFQTNMIEKVLNSKQIMASELIIFDSINELMLENDMGLEQAFRYISHFMQVIREGKTIFLNINPEMVSGQLFTQLRNMSHIYIKMLIKEHYGVQLNLMRVERFTGAKGEVSKEIPFRVKPGMGLVPDIG
jgi:flagellar protein FlaH